MKANQRDEIVLLWARSLEVTLATALTGFDVPVVIFGFVAAKVSICLVMAYFGYLRITFFSEYTVVVWDIRTSGD